MKGFLSSRQRKDPALGQSLFRRLRPLIIGLIAVIVFILVLTWGSFQLTIALVGFLNGESVWSKAQKQASVELAAYARTGDRQALANFQTNYAIVAADREARDLITANADDEETIQRDFSHGNIIPQAINSVIFAFRHLQWAPFLHEATTAWRSVDGDVEELNSISLRVEELYKTHAMTAERREAIMSRIDDLTRIIEPQTKIFSLAIANGASWLSRVLFINVCFMALAALSLWLFSARHVLRGIRSTEDRFRALFENAADAIIVVDPINEQIVDVNRTAMRWTGKPSAALIGMPYSDLFAKDDTEFLDISGVMVLAGADGHSRPVETELSRAAGSNVQVRMAVLRDVSERIALDRERREAAVMGHELKTPLNAIVVAGQALEDNPAQEEVEELLRMVKANAKLLERRIWDSIDMDQISKTGRLPMTLAAFTPQNLLDAVRTETWAGAWMRRQQLVISMAHGDPNCHVTGDPNRIQQAVSNLIGNAFKFSPEGSTITATLNTSRRDDGQIGFEFAVIDNGIGIPPDKRGSIFKAYYQAHNSKSRGYDGQGIGLYLVQTISNQMKGEIRVEDNPVGGTIIRWSFSLPEAPAESTSAGLSIPVLLAQHRLNVPPLRCLVVDDVISNRMGLRIILERAGHHVVEAKNGLEALQQILASTYDVMFLDMQMPIMSGEELLDNLQQRKLTNLPVIIAVSASSGVHLTLQDLGKPIAHYLPKPILVERLLPLLELAAERPHRTDN